MSTPILYYSIERTSQDIVTDHREAITESGSDTLANVDTKIAEAYDYIQAAEPTENRTMVVRLNSAVMAAPPTPIDTPTSR